MPTNEEVLKQLELEAAKRRAEDEWEKTHPGEPLPGQGGGDPFQWGEDPQVHESYVGPEERYRQKLAELHQRERDAALAQFGRAGTAAGYQGAAYRGDATRAMAGAANAGGPLASRHAMLAGQDAYVAGAAEATQAGSAERLAAAGAALDVQAERARLEQAAAEDYMARLASKQGAYWERTASHLEYERRAQERQQRLAGAVVSAGGAAAAGAGGG